MLNLRKTVVIIQNPESIFFKIYAGQKKYIFNVKKIAGQNFKYLISISHNQVGVHNCIDGIYGTAVIQPL